MKVAMFPIPYGRQDITDDDIAAVTAVLRSDHLTQGPQVPAFEAAIAAYCQVAHAVAVNSATSALHLACLALGVGPHSRVWTSPITFVASANCARYCGAEVDFVDIDPRTYLMCPQALEEKLRQAAEQDQLPDVVIPVHLCGQSCDMAVIHRLATIYGFRIIEDASHAIGGKYQDQPIGDCRWSDITVLSFHPVKIITTGEGGMALTPHADLAKRMQQLRSHGITRDPSEMTELSHGGWYYQQLALGFNYRMTDLQAALGLSQLQRLDSYVAMRRQHAERYVNLFSQDDVTRQLLVMPEQEVHAQSAWHLFVVQCRNSAIHRLVFEYLREQQIQVNLHYIPVYLQPYYQALGFKQGYCSRAEHYYHHAISLPMFATMSLEQQTYVVSCLSEALVRYGDPRGGLAEVAA